MRLMVFAMWLLAAHAAAQSDFHTPPNCWEGPRVFHAGAPPADLAGRVSLADVPPRAPGGDAQVSPNGAYRLWARQPDTTRPGPWSGELVVDRERETFGALLVDGIVQPLAPRWINEKLVFVRIGWGRASFSDLLWDVEAHRLVYHEQARDGSDAYAQFQEACAGTCPCAPPAATTRPLPPSRPGPDTGIGLLALPPVQGARRGSAGPERATPWPVYAAAGDGGPPVAQIRGSADVAYAEIGYEQGGAIVYAISGDWYEVRPGRRPLERGWTRGWVHVPERSLYHANAALLSNRLGYLNRHWTGELWSAPEDGAAARLSPLKRAGAPGEAEQYPADIVEARETGRGLWVRVALYAQSPCSGGAPEIVEEGWVPAYSESGERTLWYWSRGC